MPDPKETLRDYILRVWEKRELSPSAFQTSEALTYGHGDGEPFGGPEHDAFHALWGTLFYDLQAEVHEVLGEGDKACADFTLHATYQGHRLRLRGALFVRFESGKIAEARHLWDTLFVLSQLEFAPSGTLEEVLRRL